MADQIMACFAERMQTSPTVLPLMQQAVLVAKSTMLFVVMVGKQDSADTKEMMRLVHKLPAYTCFPLLTDSGLNQQWLARHVECLNMLSLPASATTFAVVSEGKKCSKPITTYAAVKEILQSGLA